MDQPSPERVTLLLQDAASGDRDAADRLLPLVYGQLRAAAQQHMRHERADHTLGATAVIHEAYLKLVGPRELPWQSRAHFYAAAAEAMRRVLIDHARAKARHGGAPLRLDEMADVISLSGANSEQIMAVDDAFRRLETEDPEAAAVVRLRFYAGLSVDQAAEALDISPRSAARLWSYARALLFRALTDPS